MMIFFIIVFYVFVGAAVGTVLCRSLNKRPGWEAGGPVVAFWGGLFWPLAFVILGGVWIGYWIGHLTDMDEGGG